MFLAEAEGLLDLGPGVGDERRVRREGDAHPADRLGTGTVVSREPGGVDCFLEQGDDVLTDELPAVLGVDGPGEHQFGAKPGCLGGSTALKGLGEERIRVREPSLEMQRVAQMVGEAKPSGDIPFAVENVACPPQLLVAIVAFG